MRTEACSPGNAGQPDSDGHRECDEKELDAARCEMLMKRAEEGLDEAAVLENLKKPFREEQQNFVKYKLELILRAHGKGTPGQSSGAGAGVRYTTLEHPVYDTGYQSGNEISFGAPAVSASDPAQFRKVGRKLRWEKCWLADWLLSVECILFLRWPG